MQEILFARKEATLRRIEWRRGKVLGCVHEHAPCSQINCKSEDGGPWQRKRIGGHRHSEFPVEHARTWGGAVVHAEFGPASVSQEKGG